MDKLKCLLSLKYISFSFILFIFMIFKESSNTGLLLISLGLLLLVGLPHGILDPLIFFRGKIKSKSKLLIFIGIYILAILIFFSFWFINPIFTLIFFLMISFQHFGMDWLHYNGKYYCFINQFILGGSIFFLPCVLYPNEVSDFIVSLINVHFIYLKELGFFWICLSLYIGYITNKHYLLDFFLLFASFYCLGIFWGFLVYFCTFHSIGHYKKNISHLLVMLKKFRFLLFFLILTTYLLMIFLVMNLDIKDFNVLNIMKISIFILSAFTMPHFIVIMISDRIIIDNKQ
ncbi:Brp/Blh family beta-carotene 15,15'-dioxygenase [Paraphotobacterium marinum]|nr:Brp/Blh family beta-carotene 15,15'-dioxygenase [Paraphotobacterium marinum]